MSKRVSNNRMSKKIQKPNLNHVQEVVCEYDGNCELLATGLRACGFCRFQKCLSVGMKPEMVKQHEGNIKTNNLLKMCCICTSKRVEMSVGESEETVDHSSLTSEKYNNLLQTSCLFPNNCFLVTKVFWIQQFPETALFHFQVVQVSLMPFEFFKIDVKASLHLLESLRFPDLDSNESSLSSTTISLRTREGHIEFHKECHLIFNVNVCTFSDNGSSLIIMTSFTEDDWFRLKQVISVSRILCHFWNSSHEVTQTVSTFNLKQEVFVQFLVSAEIQCKIISNSIESLSFFADLCAEDQLIILKESYYLIACLMFSYSYDEASESFVFTTIQGKLLFGAHKNVLKTHFLGGHSQHLDQFFNTFLKNFPAFLRKDYFVISTLCILCVLQEKPGLCCNDLFEKERRFYCELLDSYVRANVISNEWPQSRETIWNHFHQILKEVSEYALLYKQFQRDRENVARSIDKICSCTTIF